jgi:hypothetical protein
MRIDFFALLVLFKGQEEDLFTADTDTGRVARWYIFIQKLQFGYILMGLVMENVGKPIL